MTAKDKEEVKDPRPFFTNESGAKVHIRPIEVDASELIENDLKDEYRAAGKIIDQPEIEVTTAGGSKVKRLLSEAILTVEGDDVETARRQQLWLDYQTSKSEFDTQFGRLNMDFMLTGVDEPTPPDEDWVPQFQYLHMKVPDGAFAKSIFYKRHCLIITPGDFAKLQSEVLLISSSGTLDRKRVEAKVEAFFREARIRAAAMDDQGTEEETAAEPLAA